MGNVIEVLTDAARREAALENSSALKAFGVLEAVVAAKAAVTLSDLMQFTGMPKPSLHRILALFEEAGLISREPTGRSYVPGPRLARFGLDVLQHDAVAAVRRAVLRKLVADLGETCNLCVLRRGELVYLDRVEADWPLRLHLTVGTTLPPHCAASGKLLLAFKPTAERNALIEAMPLQRFTDRTITNRQLLATELDRIAANGYAVDNEEYVVGVACVAVPVHEADGNVVAAVAVHAATARLPLSRALEFVPTLNAAAAAIAKTFP
jgi:IclR family acetate operon transcriptional repressor